MQSFMLSSKSAQFLEYMELRTRTKSWVHDTDVELKQCVRQVLALRRPEHH